MCKNMNEWLTQFTTKGPVMFNLIRTNNNRLIENEVNVCLTFKKNKQLNLRTKSIVISFQLNTSLYLCIYTHPLFFLNNNLKMSKNNFYLIEGVNVWDPIILYLKKRDWICKKHLKARYKPFNFVLFNSNVSFEDLCCLQNFREII